MLLTPPKRVPKLSRQVSLLMVSCNDSRSLGRVLYLPPSPTFNTTVEVHGTGTDYMKYNTVIIFGTGGRAVGSRRLSAFVDTLTTQFSSQLFFYLWIPQDSFTSFTFHHSLLFFVLKSSHTHKARMSNCSLRLFFQWLFGCAEKC